LARSAALFLFVLLAGAVPAPAAAQGIDPVRAALEARIQQLEEDIRRLTGRVEELEYQQGQLTTRLEKLVGAVDERLRTVESAPAAPAREEPPQAVQAPEPPPVVATAPPPPRQPAPGAQARAPAPDVEPDASAQRGYVLGTIPRDAARGAPTATAPAQSGSETGYDGALKLLQAGRWPEAEKAFQDFLETNPSDSRASAAAYWLGETYYFRKDYKNAAAAFARNYRTYGPEAPRAPDNLLKLGMSLRALGDREKACQTYAELAKRHPNAPMPVRQTLTRERSAAECA
jgi:tol-pal system protein YbgF